MECVYRERTKEVGEEYDEHVLIPLLMKVFKHLNPRSKTSLTFLAFSIDDSLWGVGTSTKEINIFLMKIELSLY
jgi:hypothetical protein